MITHRNPLNTLVCSTLVLAGIAVLPALAEDKPASAHEHMNHDAAAAPVAAKDGQPLSEASKAFEAAMHKMHQDMMVPYTNDVDADFVRGMIPHHQGAIDQAEILLKYSKNPRLRRLAGGIIAAQRREIRFMVNWLKEHGQGLETSDMPDWLKNAPTTVEDAKTSGDKD